MLVFRLAARRPLALRLGWVMPYPIALPILPSQTGHRDDRALMLLPSIRLSKISPPFERQRKEYTLAPGSVKPGIRTARPRPPARRPGPRPSRPRPAPARPWQRPAGAGDRKS